MTPTELGDIIAAAWQALTDDQRTCWNFWSLQHPITSSRGDRIALYGWQAFYAINAALAVVDPALILDNPPTTTTPPPPIKVTGTVWTKRAQLASGATLRTSLAWLDLANAIPTGTAVIVKQAYEIRSSRTRRLPRNRHVTTLQEADTGPVNLQTPRGYFATTAGANKFASIKGATASRKRNKPLARLQVINTSNGATITITVANPHTPT
jgi:hypothetical protein